MGKIKDMILYNKRLIGEPKLVDKDHLPDHFAYTKENIVADAVSYFFAEPDVWHMPAKNYFVRICMADYIRYIRNDHDKEIVDYLDDDILPYDDLIAPSYHEDPKTYEDIISIIGHLKLAESVVPSGELKTWKIFEEYYKPPIRKKQLTVGYNCTGTDFFETISFYKKYIEEYYFSFLHTMPREPLDPNQIYRQLSESPKYGISANLLLNTEEECREWEKLIKMAIRCKSGIRAVSVLDLETARKIKKEYPWMKIHISTYGAQLIDPLELDPELICCVNLYEPSLNSGQQQRLWRVCKERGIKLKYIANRGCVVGKHDMMSRLANRDIMCCQNYQCKQLRADFPWIDLCRCNLQKEWVRMAPMCGIDYIKLSTRERSNEEIRNMLRYWTNYEPTRKIGQIEIPENKYPVYLEWCHTRLHDCTGDCASCRKCETYYKRLTE